MSNGASSARLGGARADFVAGLGRKVAELRRVLARVTAAPTDIAGRDELRRKLHALGSAAKMMKFDAMDRGLAEALGRLDRTSRDVALETVDIEAIQEVVEDLPALAWGDGQARSSRVEAAERAEMPKHRALVVGSSQIAEALLDDGPTCFPVRRSFACECTPDTQAAYDLIRTTEPDLLVLDADVAASAELVEALMDDPLTEAVPIVVVGSFLEPGEAARFVAMGVAKTVSKPTSRDVLRAACEDTLSPRHAPQVAVATLGEPTVEELADRLAAEIKEALVGRTDPSARGRRIPLGQGTEVLGAVWGAIARVREVVTARTDGHVRFAGGPEGALTPASFLHEPDAARSDRRTARRGTSAEVRLTGRRVVVADDDPGVVWFLADLLRTAGCIVHEAFDGQKALELAYESCPDLVISDILMPHLDGFSLCRALRRDVVLRDTPVILLSWKEDLLQRVRELGANAAGYVRKESDTRAIIARVREALHARGRIEARLREEGEVRGRLDGVSIRTLLDIVCATRPEARVSVRDATFLYEIEIRLGAPLRATRTDGDGGFLKGPKVLAQLLGVSAGRFTVTTSTSAIEADLDGNLASQLAKPVAKTRAAMALLTGAGMNTVARVRLDEEALTDYFKATPERARLVARRLANGAAPRELVMCGGCEPALLEDLLCDLAARGLVIAIEGIDGEDMLQAAVDALLPHSDARAAFAPRTATPAPVPASIDTPEIVGACASDLAAPLCASPLPGMTSSLEEAIVNEVIQASPEPARALELVASEASSVLPNDVRQVAEMTDEGTPSAEQIVALSEPTIVDSTVYGDEGDEGDDEEEELELEPYASVEAPPAEARVEPKADDVEDREGNGGVPDAERQLELTPFVSVTASDEPSDVAVAKRAKKWPMVAFIAATGVVAWAVLHFSTTGLHLLKQQQHEAPAPETPLPPAPTSAVDQDKADEVFYTAVAPETKLPAGQGLLDITAPAGAAIVIDGRERARGSASLPMPSGNHDVRVKRTPTEERGCTIDIHTSRVAHVKL